MSQSGGSYTQVPTSQSVPQRTYLSPLFGERNFSGESETTLYDAGSYMSSSDHSRDPSPTPSYDKTSLDPPSLTKTLSGKWTVVQSVRKLSDASSNPGIALLAKEKAFVGGGSGGTVPKRTHWGLFAFKDWWVPEIGAALLSLGCMIAVAAILFKIQHKALESWRFPMMPNSLLSVLLTLSKTLLLLSVAESITQLKWNHFARRPRPLRDFQVFDDAIGAVIIVLSLAMDPFAQQILSFPSRLVPLSTSPATVPVAYQYGSFANNTPVDIDFGMQRAVYGGLFSDQTTSLGSCATGNCSFSNFHSLGLCHQCRDISTGTTLTCQKWYNNYTMTSSYTCQYQSPSGAVFEACSLTGMKAPESCFNVMSDAGHTKFTSIANTNPNLTTLVDFAAITTHNPNDIRPNITMKPGTILECSIDWCAKQYPAWNISNGKLSYSNMSTSPLAPFPMNATQGLANINSATYTTTQSLPNVTRDLTFVIGGREQSNLKTFLANVFTTSLSSANASENWPPRLDPSSQITMASALFQANNGNMSQTVAALASSLQAQIRQGNYSQHFRGTTWRSETYIDVKWVWLILPTFWVLLGIFFLLASLLRTWMTHTAWTAPQWKSSTIAPLFHGLEGVDGQDVHAVGLHSRFSMEAVARKMQVQLRPDVKGETRFCQMDG